MHGRLHWATLFALITLLAGSIGTLIWASSRSLGLGDEGVYLLAARFPEDMMQNVSAVYFYNGALFRLVGYDPTLFRRLGIALVLGSAVILWLGFTSFRRHFTSGAQAVISNPANLLFLLTGAMVYYQWFFATPNNYTLTAIALNLLLGAVLYGLRHADEPGPLFVRAVLGFFGAGLFLGLLLFTKVPSGLCLTFACYLLVLLWGARAPFGRAQLCGAMLLGILAWSAIHFLAFVSAQQSWQGFKDGWALYQAFGVHVPALKIWLYAGETLALLRSGLQIFWPGYLILLFIPVFDRLRPNRVGKGWDELLPLAAVVVVACLITFVSGWSLADRIPDGTILPFYLVYHLGWILLLIATVVTLQWRNAGLTPIFSTGFRSVVLMGFLIAAPLGAAVGTANPLSNVTAFYSLPWFVAVLLSLQAIGKGRSAQIIASLSILSIATVSTGQTIAGAVLNPQQISTNLRSQSVRTPVGSPESTLYLDAKSSDLIVSLKALAVRNGFQPGDDVIASSYLPSLVFALGARSPGHPAFLSTNEGERKYSELALGFAQLDRLENAFVLINTSEAEMSALLMTQGLAFPGNYRKLGQIAYSGANYSLWKPMGQ